jgi:hypothetical protein
MFVIYLNILCCRSAINITFSSFYPTHHIGQATFSFARNWIPEDIEPKSSFNNGKADPLSGSRKEELEIGEVDDSNLDKIHEILKDLRIDLVESSGWNCQNWALDGFEKLKEEGFVYDYLTQEAVKNWLKEN